MAVYQNSFECDDGTDLHSDRFLRHSETMVYDRFGQELELRSRRSSDCLRIIQNISGSENLKRIKKGHQFDGLFFLGKNQAELYFVVKEKPLMKHLLYFLPFILTLYSCNTPKSEEQHVNKGEVTVAADESFKYIVKAQVAAYESHYPDTKFHVIYTPEQKAIGLMLSDSAQLAVVSRGLSEDEQRYYTSRNIEYEPAKMALDAVVFIVNKENPLEELSLNEIKQTLEGDSLDFKLVFDNSSSSNLNTLISELGIQNLSRKNIFAANGTEDVFDYISKNKKNIGVVGLNWISDTDDKRAVALKETVKILGVKGEDGKAVTPSLASLRAKTYPLPKTVYLLTTQHRWGVAKGFVRFACTQIGQLVVEKMGLQPYFIIPKKYEMTPGPNYETVE